MDSEQKGKIYIVGFGPGNHEHLTFRAKEAIEDAEIIIGYSTYIDLVSDLLTPIETIYKRVEMAAAADFVIVLYNPKSGRRTKQIEETQRLVLKHRAPTTPVVIAKSVYREGENIVMTDLEHMLDYEMG